MSRMSEPKPDGKPFAISKRLVWEAWRRVKANRGAEGVDEESIEEFEANLRGNLYKLWNRMSSGSYMPPPVRAVEIPKKGGRGVRVLGVPTVADRIAGAVGPRCVGDMPAAVLEIRLGSGFGSQVVFRLARSLARSEGGRSPHEPAVDPPLRGAMAQSAAPTRGRHPEAQGSRQPARVRDLACAGEHLPALRARHVARPGVPGRAVRALRGR